jgi:hypothetical protein
MLNISEKFSPRLCLLIAETFFFLSPFYCFLISNDRTKIAFSFPFTALAGSQVVNKNEPMFVSRSEAFKFAVGDVITLPCQVTHEGKFFRTLILNLPR